MELGQSVSDCLIDLFILKLYLCICAIFTNSTVMLSVVCALQYFCRLENTFTGLHTL